MTMPHDVNLLAVLVAAIASMVLGFLWYSKMLFGGLWMDLTGITEEDCKENNMLYSLGGQFAANVVMAFILAALMNMLEVGSLAESILLVFWLWLGFIATIGYSSTLWEKHSIPLFFLNSAQNLVMMLLMGVVLFSLSMT